MPSRRSSVVLSALGSTSCSNKTLTLRLKPNLVQIDIRNSSYMASCFWYATSMGLFLKQNEPRTQLQSKDAADLAERLQKRSIEGNTPQPQPAILDDQRTTSPLAWVWLLLGV